MTAQLRARDLDGVTVPLLTPFDRDGAVDPDGLARLVDRMVEAHVVALLALGTTGEFAELTPEERDTVLATVVAAARGRVPVIAGVGGVGTVEACGHAARAAQAGADAVLVLPPLYHKASETQLCAHFEAVARACALPVLLYDFPELSGTALPADLLARITDAVPTTIGVKLSGGDLRRIHAALARLGDDPHVALLAGAESTYLPGLLAGADGAILAVANVDPALPVALHRAWRAGDIESATALHADLLHLGRVMGICDPPMLGLKLLCKAAGLPLEAVVRTAPGDVDRIARDVLALESGGWRRSGLL